MTAFPSSFPGGFGHSASALERAQDLIYEAWEARSATDQVRLAKEALATSDQCADAHVLLAELSAGNVAEARRYYERGVAAGEAALGPDTFERAAGHFWGILETRPYMRARAGLAECLWVLGECDVAIGHYREMLRLNPNDNQGLRWELASWLLEVNDHDALRDLLDAYDDDASTVWPYTRTLLAFREGREEARSALKEAWEWNSHVPDLILGVRRVPKRLPLEYRLRSREEAYVYVADNRENWMKTPGATEWLKREVETLRAAAKERTSASA